MKGVLRMIIKYMQLSIKSSSVLEQKKYGTTRRIAKPLEKSVLSSRSYGKCSHVDNRGSEQEKK